MPTTRPYRLTDLFARSLTCLLAYRGSCFFACFLAPFLAYFYDLQVQAVLLYNSLGDLEYNNVYSTGVSGVGSWGTQSCVCPDGQVYQVGGAC